jgi:hypothetical protein
MHNSLLYYILSPARVYNKEVNCACVGEIITIINENARNTTHKKREYTFKDFKCEVSVNYL